MVKIQETTYKQQFLTILLEHFKRIKANFIFHLPILVTCPSEYMYNYISTNTTKEVKVIKVK